MLGPLSSPQCLDDLSTLKSVCGSLGVPSAVNKEEGPTTCLTFLGTEIDSFAAQLRLPSEKLQRLLPTLALWGDKKVCLCKQLESLIGFLNHACKVVRPGHAVLRRIIHLLLATEPSYGCSSPNHHIWLNREFQADLAW